MPSRSRFAKRSSIRRAGAAALAGAAAVWLVLSGRRRYGAADEELRAQASFLESLVQSIGAISSARRPDDVLDRTLAEARRLFRAEEVRLLPAPEAAATDAHVFPGGMRVPLGGGGRPIGILELTRREPFHAADVARATVLAEFAARAAESARLIDEAREREDERARLTERVITAEQDERRRLSIFLHDGPVQAMSGIALMHDAALAAIRESRHEDAAKLIQSSLERERDTIRTLRDLSFAIEPIVLRDQGFGAAVRALGEQVERSHGITVSADVDAGERLGEKAQVALYQLIRESLNQAVRRRPRLISVRVGEDGDGNFTTEIADDGMGERRRAGIEELDERVRVLNGRVSVETGPEGGTLVRVALPSYVAAAAG